jgi:CRP-like cAMP-binding protein
MEKIDLKQIPFFSKFPEDLLIKLEVFAKKIAYKKGEHIIEQGAKNESLFFLLEGALAVFVDNGLVAKLKNKGDLVGEMSLISQLNSTATITAEVDSLLLNISGRDLQAVTNNEGDLTYNVFKIYSDILVQKLEATNHRAKKIEEYSIKLKNAQEELEAINASLEIKVKDRTAKLEKTNEELKNKNNEIQATNTKLTDLYQSRDATFKSLDELLNRNLIPLKESLNILKQKDQSEEINRGVKEVSRAINRLEPLTNAYQSEKSLTSKKVLFAESVKKQHSIAKLALGGTGVELDIAETIEEAKEKLANNQYNIFMFNKEFLEIIDFARIHNPNARFVFVTSESIPDYVPTLLKQSLVPNVVSRDEEDKQFTIKNFVTTISKLASGNYFGLEKYISWGIDVKQVDVISSDQRPTIIEKMDQYFEKTGLRSSNRSRCTVVAEELLMNAIYDAPRDADGKSLFNHKDRTQVVKLNESQQAIFRYATDGVTMAISIEDPFGSLDAQTLFKYLEKCYQGGSLNDGRADKGGGGRGLHQIIENSDLVVFNIDMGKRTEVIALFNADQKASPHRNPNLHFFKAS